MSNKELQEQRVKGYFIDAAKQMIKGEGIRSVSARGVSEYAGYSYATLYNYFKDLKELIFICVDDFLQEIRDYVKQNSNQDAKSLAGIISKTTTYSNYFVQYIGIFDLLFLEKMPEFSFTQGKSNEICNLIIELTEENWLELQTEKNWTDEYRTSKQDKFRLFLAGALLYYLNRRIPSDYREFLTNLKANISDILE